MIALKDHFLRGCVKGVNAKVSGKDNGEVLIAKNNDIPFSKSLLVRNGGELTVIISIIDRVTKKK